MSHKKGKKSNILDFPKCVRCSCDLIDDFQLIFDDTGLELELQKLLAVCFDMDIKISLNEIQALCDDCLNELIDTYDIIQRNEEDGGKSLNTGGIDERKIKEEIESIGSECDLREDPLIDDDLNIGENVDEKSLEEPGKSSSVDNRKRVQNYSKQNSKGTKKPKIDSKTESTEEVEDYFENEDINEQLIDDKSEQSSKETEKPEIVSTTKDAMASEDNAENEEDTREQLINHKNEVDKGEENETHTDSNTGKRTLRS